LLKFYLFDFLWHECRIQLDVTGKAFYEEVEARDYKEAGEVALARNPNAKVMDVAAVM
jgi:hypothetical protein